jgi:hypothetical protein
MKRQEPSVIERSTKRVKISTPEEPDCQSSATSKDLPLGGHKTIQPSCKTSCDVDDEPDTPSIEKRDQVDEEYSVYKEPSIAVMVSIDESSCEESSEDEDGDDSEYTDGGEVDEDIDIYNFKKDIYDIQNCVSLEGDVPAKETTDDEEDDDDDEDDAVLLEVGMPAIADVLCHFWLLFQKSGLKIINQSWDIGTTTVLLLTGRMTWNSALELAIKLKFMVKQDKRDQVHLIFGEQHLC